MNQEHETAIDPVCGMTVDIEHAAAAGLTAELPGTTYYFCGRGCKLEFNDEPRKYLDPNYSSPM